jgi:hypothetical protein
VADNAPLQAACFGEPGVRLPENCRIRHDDGADRIQVLQTRLPRVMRIWASQWYLQHKLVTLT